MLAEAEVLAGIAEFEKREPREAMYKVATQIINQTWGKPADMADGLGVLLLTWNNAHYRYGGLSFEALEKCIAANLSQLTSFRSRTILSYEETDRDPTNRLFGDFLKALAIRAGKSAGKKSPVAVAKALHLLAPDFFPLWDRAIAAGYGCRYDHRPEEAYARFCVLLREAVREAKEFLPPSEKTHLKLIDEFNFAKFTGKWLG